jgi:hypothetical protein
MTTGLGWAADGVSAAQRPVGVHQVTHSAVASSSSSMHRRG